MTGKGVPLSMFISRVILTVTVFLALVLFATYETTQGVDQTPINPENPYEVPQEPIPAFRLKDVTAYYLAFFADGKTLTVCEGGSVSFWNVAAGKRFRRWEKKGHRWITSYSSDGKTVAMGDFGLKVYITDTATGKEVCQLSGEYDYYKQCRFLVFSPDNQLLVGVLRSNNGPCFHFWDTATGRELPRLSGPEKGIIRMVALSPDNKTLALGFDGTDFELYDLATRKKLRRITVLREPHPDDRFDVSSQRMFEISALAFSSDGKALAVGNNEGHIDLWDVATGKQREHLGGGSRSLKDHGVPEVAFLAFSPDGKSVISVDKYLRKGMEGRIRLWEVASAKPIYQFIGQRGLVKAVALSPDGKTLAVASDHDGEWTVAVWDVPALVLGKQLGEARLPPKELEARWDELANEDVRKAHQAMWTLAASPDQSVPFLKEQLKPETREPPVARLLADLDSEQFAVRQKATQELENLGREAGPALRKALEGKPPPEVRRLVEQLLARLDGSISTPERLRTIRAVTVLEQIGTPEARRVLEGLTKGRPAAELTEEAKTALERLAKRAEGKP